MCKIYWILIAASISLLIFASCGKSTSDASENSVIEVSAEESIIVEESVAVTEETLEASEEIVEETSEVVSLESEVESDTDTHEEYLYAVTISINPQITLHVDKNEAEEYYVTSWTCDNADAEELFEGIVFSDKSIEDVIEEAVNVLTKENILTSDKEIAVSVYTALGEEVEAEDELVQYISEAVCSVTNELLLAMSVTINGDKLDLFEVIEEEVKQEEEKQIVADNTTDNNEQADEIDYDALGQGDVIENTQKRYKNYEGYPNVAKCWYEDGSPYQVIQYSNMQEIMGDDCYYSDHAFNHYTERVCSGLHGLGDNCILLGFVADWSHDEGDWDFCPYTGEDWILTRNPAKARGLLGYCKECNSDIWAWFSCEKYIAYGTLPDFNGRPASEYHDWKAKLRSNNYTNTTTQDIEEFEQEEGQVEVIEEEDITITDLGYIDVESSSIPQGKVYILPEFAGKNFDGNTGDFADGSGNIHDPEYDEVWKVREPNYEGSSWVSEGVLR